MANETLTGTLDSYECYTRRFAIVAHNFTFGSRLFGPFYNEADAMEYRMKHNIERGEIVDLLKLEEN